MAPFRLLTISSFGVKGRRMSPCLPDVDPGYVLVAPRSPLIGGHRPQVREFPSLFVGAFPQMIEDGLGSESIRPR
jgi:hypothetical protein